VHDLLQLLLAEATTAPPPPHTTRDVRLPAVPGKAISVIGVRRSGKTTFLWQILAERIASGMPRDSLIMLQLEDDRLAGMGAEDLDWLLEAYWREHPKKRGVQSVVLFLDEIHQVQGWEKLVRRLMDKEKMEIFLSGSSAKLLSREVATSMRGRGMEVLVHPFSFREALRHAGAEPSEPWERIPASGRSELDHHLRRYLKEGGFPEAQGLADRDRHALLRSYVDVVVLRDVIERHGVSNPLSLEMMRRHLLSNPAGLFSVQKLYDSLKSQGVPTSKDKLHAYLAHLEDAFLIRTVSLHTASERKRMVNPRKVYPIDPGLIPLYERTGRPNWGHALETAVMLELERRGYEVYYVRTEERYEVDLIAIAPGEAPTLIQVTTEMINERTYEREVRALASAARERSSGRYLLITLDSVPPRVELPAPVEWRSAAGWLLDS